MIRLGFLLIGLTISTVAPASQGHVVHRFKGGTVTETLSVLAPCGKDLVIAVSDGDQHFIFIEYHYNGTFPFIAGSPMRPVRETRSGAMNVSVGAGTHNGTIVRVHADAKGLICDGKWVFNIAALQVDNTSQMRRDREADWRRKKELELEAAQRKQAEIAAGKIKSQEMMSHLKRLEEEAAAKRLAAYRAQQGPDDPRCLINEPADITRCEQLKTRLRMERLARESTPLQQPSSISPEAASLEQARADRMEYLVGAVEKAKRDMAISNCAYTALPLPPPVPYPRTSQPSRSVNAGIDASNRQMDQWYSAALKDASSACTAGRSPAMSWPQAPWQGQAAPQDENKILQDMIDRMR